MSTSLSGVAALPWEIKKKNFSSYARNTDKVGRLVSKEVTLQLIKSKCIPVHLYGLVTCPLDKSQLLSVDFAMNRFLMKLFSTSNMEVITYCREQFNFELPSVILARHTSLFLDKLRHCDTCLIKNVMRT